MNILVIGGTLFIGRHLVNALRAVGHTVTVLHRNPESALPPGVNSLLGDRNDFASVQQALSDQRFDAVFDNVYDWQRGTTADQVIATARACAHPGLKRYVFMSSVAAYPAGLDHVESDALVPNASDDAYARNKAASERALFALHEKEPFPVVTLRPPFVYGPDNPFYREAFFWDRIRDGRPIIMPGDGNRLMQFVYVHDLVWCCLRVLENDAAVGQAFNVGDIEAITQEELVFALSKAAGRDSRIVHVRREEAVAKGGHPMGPKMYFAQYYDLPSITMKIDKARDVLGFAPTGFDDGLHRTYDWWLKNNPFPPPAYSFDDELLAGRV